jgi:DNA repair protein RecO (recombination protein O)
MYRSNGKLYKTEAIILSRKNVSEGDRILTVFSKEFGKLRVIAKGVRKISSKRGPHLEIFSQVTMVVYKSSSLDMVSEVTPVSNHPDRQLDLDTISIAYFYCELISLLLPEKQEHRDVYDLLSHGLAQLYISPTIPIYAQSRTFVLTLLRYLGFLDQKKELRGKELQNFIENITERKLKTPKLIRQFMES